MKKISRVCFECGKQHDTGVENKITGEFDPVDKCIDCLMSKCSMDFQDLQVHIDDTKNLTEEEMKTKLLEKTACLLHAEYGGTNFVSTSGFSGQICDENDKPIESNCKCGNAADTILMGMSSYIGLCNKCIYG